MTNAPDANYTVSQARHDVSTTIHHWQLRDLVSAGDTSDEFLAVCETSVLHCNVVTDEVTSLMSLNWTPNSMTYAHGILAAGGPASQLCVKDLREKRVLHREPLGGSVNNALHIARLGGDLLLYACNNDYTVKVYTIEAHDISPCAMFRTPVPINHCALSPDGRHLSAVGDCEHTLVYGVREAEYALDRTFSEAHDTGTSTAWSPSGGLMASAHQDGTLCVWDVRQGQPVHRRQLPSACRSVKFAPGGVADLLSYAEHEDVVHVVDTRAWAAVQHLNAGCGQGHDISGIAFSAAADRLWVGLDDCVVSYDMDSVGRRCHAYGRLC